MIVLPYGAATGFGGSGGGVGVGTGGGSGALTGFSVWISDWYAPEEGSEGWLHESNAIKMRKRNDLGLLNISVSLEAVIPAHKSRTRPTRENEKLKISWRGNRL